MRLRPHAKMHKSATIAQAADRSRRGRRVRAEAQRGRGAGRARRGRHLHQQRARRPGQARSACRAGRPHPAGDRGRFGARCRAPGERAEGAGRERSTCSSRSTSARAAAALRRPRPGACAPGRRAWPALRRPAGLPRQGPAPAQRGRTRGGVAPHGRAGACGAGRHHARRHRLPARHRRRHRHLRARGSERRVRRTAVPAATCSWTATTPTTSRRRVRRASSMRCSSSRR